jgi:hypothetical protein
MRSRFVSVEEVCAGIMVQKTHNCPDLVFGTEYQDRLEDLVFGNEMGWIEAAKIVIKESTGKTL